MSIPITFKALQLRNFLSFGNQLTEVDLGNYGSTLIQGENVDASSNNGAGKTTIINAICYAIYNKPFDNIGLQRLINSTNGARSTLMEVRLTFTKGEDEYEIYRCRGEQTNIQIFCNNQDVTLDSVSENDRFVEEIIGLSYDLFTKIIIFSGNSTPFLLLPVHPQRQLIEELFNITLLTEKAVKLKEIIKGTEGSISVQEAIIKEQEAAVALYNKQLTDAEARVKRWEDDRVSYLKNLEGELELLSDCDMATERELHALVEQLSTRQVSVTSHLSIARKDRSSVTADIKKVETELKHLTEDKCPYCLQQYEGAADRLVEKQTFLDKRKTRLKELETVIDQFETELADVEGQLAGARELMKFKSLADAVRAETSALTAQQRIDETVNATNPHVEAYEALKQHAVKKVTYDVLDELKKEQEHQQFLLKLLTDKNSFIRRRIINRTIPFLNARLIHYTKQLGLPHVVKFDDDMSCTVSEFGRELDFGNLSSGEKKRVNLSLSLAFRDVLHHLHSKVNCLFIDEIDASLDGAGVEAVFKLLKQKTRDDGLGLWIISHRPEAIGRFDRQIIVRKQNGFSSIVDHDAQIDEVEEALT
jgi:DNA repair exonuclease SbcCD ATPase subunit